MPQVQSPVIPIVGRMIAEWPGTISLGQGVVHYSPPDEAIRAAEQFLSSGNHHKYQPVDGIGPLQERIRQTLLVENRLADLERSAIVVTAGGNMAFFNALLAIADDGDEIVLVAPYYFNHEMAVTMLGCRPIIVPSGADYQLNIDAIRRAVTYRTKAVVTVSPNNPAGAVYREQDLRELNAWCADRGIFHSSDEAYEYFVYDASRHFSPGSIPGAADHTISLYSLSKAYGMASWRIGYMVLPADRLVAVKKAQDTILICPPVVSQHAACGALDAGSGFWQPRVDTLSHVRRLVLDRLKELEDIATVGQANGAFYVLLEVRTSLGQMDFVERLVRDFHVAVIPGETFGLGRGCHLRISYGALEEASVAEAIDRLVKGIRTICQEFPACK
jgi:aspartate/methionine/tyrosine aminotransferase